MEHGQDESPEETARQKTLKRKAAKEDLKNIEAVKGVMGDAIKHQMASGVAVSDNAKQAMHALEKYGREKAAIGNEGLGDESKAKDSVEKAKEEPKPVNEREEDPDAKKSKAAQEYVKSLEKAKADSSSLFRGQKGKQSEESLPRFSFKHHLL